MVPKAPLLRTVLAVGLLLLTGCGGVSTADRSGAPPTPSPSAGTPTTPARPSVPGLRLPPGFRITEFAAGLSNPRFLTFGPQGVLLVAERGSGRVVALPDANRDGAADAPRTLVDQLDAPTSLAFDGDDLYIGETSRVTRVTLAANLQATDRRVLVPNLPTGGNHQTRTVLVGRDGALYVSIGSSCNTCVEADARRATVWRYALDGSGGRLFAHGLRNAVGMAVHPTTGAIWVTNNGSDYLGEDAPPETIYALRDGAEYGWPRCHAGTLVDPQFGRPGACDGVEQPLARMQAHSAPLGLAFALGGPFPAEYRGLFVAFHGSWNRAMPTGYKVVLLPLDAQGAIAGPPRDFVTGWLNGSAVSGRPVGLAVGPDGALYISDDQGGRVYRVTYSA